VVVNGESQATNAPLRNDTTARLLRLRSEIVARDAQLQVAECGKAGSAMHSSVVDLLAKPVNDEPKS
jgi:hypothetical protein